MRDDLVYEFEAPLWAWAARRDLWTFVSLSERDSSEIRDVAGDIPRGFGGVRVQARIGLSTWRTSIFPSGGEGRYALPVKRAVREPNGLSVGDDVRVWLQLLP